MLRGHQIDIAYFFSSPLVRQDVENGRPVYKPMELLAVREEMALLKASLREAHRAVRWRMEVATSENFRKVITLGCKALHFSGHGLPDFVTFESGRGEMHLLDRVGLRELFEAGRGADGVEFVFVSACHSQSVGEAFVACGVPHVVAVQTSHAVLDKASRIFSQAFYTALLIGHSVRNAFEIGQAALKHDPSIVQRDEQRKFVLLGCGDHSRSIFEHAPAGELVDLTHPPPVNHCDTVAEHFLGRSIEVQAVLSLIAQSRWVTVHGVKGVGKTQVALKACEYAAERCMFDELFFVPLQLLEPPSPADPDPAAEQAQLVHLFAAALSITLPLPPADPTLPFMNRICQRFADPARRCLLLLDGAEAQLAHNPNFPHFLDMLFRRTRGLQVLCTSVIPLRGCLPSVTEKVLELRAMALEDSARLFALHAPRRLRLQEMGVTTVPDSHEAVYRAFARTPVIQALGGHPGAVAAIASRIGADMLAEADALVRHDIPQLLARLQADAGKFILSDMLNDRPPLLWRKFSVQPQMPQAGASAAGGAAPAPSTASGDMAPHSVALGVLGSPVPAITPEVLEVAAQLGGSRSGATLWLRLAGDAPWREAVVEWEAFAQALQEHFASALPVAASARPLRPSDLAFIHRSRRLSPVLPATGRVAFPGFQRLWLWYRQWLHTVDMVQAEWACTSPLLIVGFADNADTQQLLRDSPQGTFIVRFSESTPTALAMAWKEAGGSVHSVLVDVVAADHFLLPVDARKVKFPSLPLLVHACHQLRTLHPGVPKEEAFRVRLSFDTPPIMSRQASHQVSGSAAAHLPQHAPSWGHSVSMK